MTTARYGPALPPGKHGTIYAIGVSSGLSAPIVPAVEAYDQKTGSWSALAPMPTPRRYLVAATDREGSVYAIGGAVWAVCLGLVQCLEPATDNCRAASALTVARGVSAASGGLCCRLWCV